MLDTEALPRHAFDLIVAMGTAQRDGDALAELVALRNSLTRNGKLLVVFGGRDAWSDLGDLSTQAGFTRIQKLAQHRSGSSTLVLQR